MIRLWMQKQGTASRVTSIQSGLFNVVFSPGSRRAVLGPRDKTIRLWDIETREQLRPPLKGVDIRSGSPDGKQDQVLEEGSRPIYAPLVDLFLFNWS